MDRQHFESLFTRRWVCMVVRSGFHNGSYCTPDDPHGEPWRCGYRHEASLSDDMVEVIKRKRFPNS